MKNSPKSQNNQLKCTSLWNQKSLFYHELIVNFSSLCAISLISTHTYGFYFSVPQNQKKGNIELSQLMTEYTSLLGTLHTSQINIPLDCCIQNSMMIQSNLGYATYSIFCFKTRIERRQNKSTKKYAYRPFLLVSLLICFNIKHPPERK